MQRYEAFYKRSTLKKILYISCSWIALISKLTPKKKGLYAFGSMNGFAVSDNSKYLFSNSNSNLSSYFITKNKDILKTKITDTSYPVYAYSLKGLAIQLFAEKVYFTHGIYDFFPPLIWGSEKHNLWHGVPLKEIGPDADWRFNSNLTKKIKATFYKLFGHLYYMSCDYVYCPFEDRIGDYKRFFSVSNPQIVIKKQPRNIYSATPSTSKDILYAPTYRGSNFKDFQYADFLKASGLFDKDFLEFLNTNNLQLKLRPHPIDAHSAKSILLPNRIILDETPDLYESLKSFHLVITDYSSIFLDCKECDIPCYFITPDLDQYEKVVGLDKKILKTISEYKLTKFSDIKKHY